MCRYFLVSEHDQNNRRAIKRIEPRIPAADLPVVLRDLISQFLLRHGNHHSGLLSHSARRVQPCLDDLLQIFLRRNICLEFTD